MTTNWDELEGHELNEALAPYADRANDALIPDYANSVDASLRDLVPLLDSGHYWQTIGYAHGDGKVHAVPYAWGALVLRKR